MIASLVQPLVQPLAAAMGSALVDEFSVRSQFAAGEQGMWYDNSDLSTMFADPTGFTPATVNSGVAFQIDKRAPLTAGAELTTNGAFASGAGWALSGATISGGTLNIAGAVNGSGSFQSSANYNLGYYEITLVVSAISAGAVTATLGIGSPSALNALNITAPGTYTFRQANYSADTFLRVYSVGASTTATIESVSVKLLSGNHRYQLTAANEPVLRQDAGGNYYLEYNGTSSFLQTRAINFTGTDKMTVVSGASLSASAVGMLVELSAAVSANAGSFYITAGEAVGGVFGFRGKGTTEGGYNSSARGAPFTAVLSMQVDIGAGTLATEIVPRINGVVDQTTPLGGAGTGNFGNHAIYFGARAGTSLFFNGREYLSVIRGAATADAPLSALERLACRRAGISL